MEGAKDFRAGQRVRIRTDADSDFRGYYGVIMHVGAKVCDVRIHYKPKGSKVRSTYIGTFPKEDLERPNRATDLAAFRPPRNKGFAVWLWVWIGLFVTILVGLVLLVTGK